mmetsp:Transcript_31758/g.36107  ORF Transcript_31758/g.36107 Transcript_31758/m.36107 type:complete len:278 (-) Transcript_31758:415-1248(-)
MNCSCINSYSLFFRDIRTILEIVVLSFLLGLESQTCQTTQILLADSLVNSGSSSNSFSIVIRGIGPMIGLQLDVSQNHILNGNGHAGNLPRDVSLPTSPSFRKMLQDGLSFIGFDTFGHHILDINHNRSSQFKIKLRFHTLLCDGLGDSLAMSTFELTCQKIAKPSFQQRNDTSEEEKPDSPTGCPETTTWSLSDRTGIESIVNQMLKIFAHSDLSHQSVFVTIHTSELTNMCENILQTVSKLEGIDVTQPILDIRVDNQFHETQDFSTQMEGVTET